MSLIHITDGQSDEILAVINKWDILHNTHRKSLKDTLETFDFETFADKKFSAHLGKHNRVVIPEEDGTYRELVIERAGKYRDKDGVLKADIYTSASYLLLRKAKVISPQTLPGQTASTLVAFTVSGTEWQPGVITFAGVRTFHIEAHTNPYVFLKRIANEFELELRFRIVIDGHKIIGRFVDLLPRLGQWSGREAEFGKDLIGMERVENITNLVTALIGIGPEREDGTKLEVFVEDKDALARWGRRGQHLIETYEPQTTDQEMTIERLTQLTQMELNKRVNALVEYRGDIADLEQVPGMQNKKIRFGDTIKIKDTKFSPPLYLEARVHTLIRSITDKSVKTVELGDYIEYTEEQVNALWKSLQAQIRQKVSMTDVLGVTYTKPEVDAKDESVFTDGTYYSDQVAGNAKQEAIDTAAGDATEKANNAENKAKEHAEEKAQEAENRSKEHADVKAGEALRLANERLVETKELLDYQLDGLNNQVGDLYSSAAEIENSLLAVSSSLHSLSDSVQVDVNALHNRADSLLQRVNEQEFDMLNVSGRVVSVEQHIDTLTGQMSLTINQLSNLDGVVSDHSVSLQAHAGLIEGKASQTSVNSLTGRVTSTEGSIQAIAGQVSLKANAEEVYTKSEMNTELGMKVDTTVYNHQMAQLDISIDGILADVTSIENEVSDVESRITTTQSQLDIQAGWINAKAEKAELQTVDGKVTNVRNDLATLQIAYDGISTNVSSLRGDMEAMEGAISDVQEFASSINQKADSIQTSVTSLTQTVNSQGNRLANAETTIVQHATSINLKANSIDVYTKSQTNAELANKADASTVSSLTSRVATAESELSVQATAINQRVTTTTYNAGIASKENTVVKQNTAPSHSNGRLWLDTSKTPNILMRSTGSAWVKASPTTAAEVGAYSSMEGSSLAGRITTAETTLNLLPGQLSAKASQIEVSDLTGRVSTAESTLNLLPGQLNAKVEKDGIIAAFNMSPEAIKLQADRIELVGAVTVLSDITGNLGDMTAGTINGVVINGSEINGGRFATTQGSTTVVIQDGYVLNVADINNITAHPRAYMQDGFFMARSAGTRELTQYAPHQLIHEHLDGQRYTLKSNAGINVDASLAVLKESVFHATPIMQFGNTSDLSVSRSRIIAHDFRYTNQAGQLTSVVASIALENYNTGGTGWFDVESRRHVGFTFYTRNNGSWTTAFRIDPAGNFFAAGSKSAVVQTENYGKRAMYAYEGTQNWFFDMMDRKLEAGKWFIELNPMFQETIAEEFFVKVYEQNPCSVRLIKREAKGFWIMVETTEPYAEVVFEVYGLRRGYEYDYMNSIEEEAA
ncbi:hypothetical protein M3936_14285 [Sutcliffiella horikoshii]|uniref:phage tail spike protein n=1 Tax=Sutcliffiella horikoshii TaxID=79883 RepID=UPI00203DF22F|nr:phage tail spike protein [Sutcliffiella horikoshii]MCM3618756.1 hypothetical protein [Sutcliffiella horikoshii]